MDTGQPETGQLDQAVSAAGLEATSQLVASALDTGTFKHTDTHTYTKRQIHITVMYGQPCSLSSAYF